MDAADFVDTVRTDLLGKERDRLNGELGELIAQNAVKGNPPHGFLYGGEFYTNLPGNMRRMAVKKIIHPELRTEASEFITALRLWQKDMQDCTNAIVRGLRECSCWQDVRDIFPNVIGMIHPETQKLQRSRPVGFPFEGMALQSTQFQMAVVEPLEYLASNRMF